VVGAVRVEHPRVLLEIHARIEHRGEPDNSVV
jgi:hypothetical protein